MNFKEKLIKYFNLDEQTLSDLTKDVERLTLPSYDNFQGMDKAYNIIKEAMNNNEKIVVYGDYDCDGIMATSILFKCFKMLNYPLGYYVPSRYIEGYGLNISRVNEFYQKGYKLIITVDNGIAQFEAIKRAYELGMKVIVTDHHEMQEVLPSCEVILHPIISNYGPVVSCGAYVAFMLAYKLLGYLDEYLLSLASIATISDMMVLKMYNRDIVRMGIHYMNKNKYLPIQMLAENCVIDENIIGIKIAPKINALGRMVENTSINMLVEFMTSGNKERLKQIYDIISVINEKRKMLTNDSVNNLKIEDNTSAISLITDLKEGVIGLLANNLLNKYKKPVVVLTKDSHNDLVLKGSARARKGFAINEFLLENKDLFLTSGGHEQAGGLSLLLENYDEFYKRLQEYANAHPFCEEKEDFIEISITDISEDNYKFIRTLAPFGEGFKMPLLKICNLKVSAITYSKSKLHILYPLSPNQKIIGFNYSSALLSNYDYVNIYGDMGYSIFNGKTSFDFNIKRIEDTNNIVVEKCLK